MFKFRVLALSGVFLFSVSSGSYAEDWIAKNNNVQIDKSEAKEIVNALILSGQINKENLSATHVDKAIKDYVLYKNLAQEAYNAKLDNNPDVKKLLDLTRLRTLSTVYLKQYVGDVKLPDLEAAAYEEYMLDKQRFKQPETIHAQHILIEISENESLAKSKAESIREKLLSGKHNFADLAEEFSADASVKKNKGDLGSFPRGKMVPEFEKEAFNLKVGEISKPFKTQFGFHIIKIMEKTPEKALSFDEVKQDLITNLQIKYKRDVYNNKMYDTLMTPDFKMNNYLINKITEEIKGNN